MFEDFEGKGLLTEWRVLQLSHQRCCLGRPHSRAKFMKIRFPRKWMKALIVMSLSCHCHVDIPIVKWRMCNLKSDAMLLNHASHASHAPTHPKAKEQWGNDCQTGRFQQAWTFYEDMLNCNISARFLCVALGGTIKSFSAANLLLTFF